jgi:hypothetical protein
MAATYHVLNQGVAYASAKSMTDVFQSSSGTNTISCYRIFFFNNGTAAVTGVLTTMVVRVQNTSASAGTSSTIVKHKSSDASPGANISAGTGRTIGAGSTVRRIVWSNDEPAVSTATIDEMELLVPNCEIWNSAYGDSNVEPLRCVAAVSEGIDLQQAGSSAVGSADCEFELTIV